MSLVRLQNAVCESVNDGIDALNLLPTLMGYQDYYIVLSHASLSTHNKYDSVHFNAFLPFMYVHITLCAVQFPCLQGP